MATRRDWDFAGACNPGEVSIGLTLCSPASCAMTKGTHEGGLARVTSRSHAPSGSEAARPAELVFRLFIASHHTFVRTRLGAHAVDATLKHTDQLVYSSAKLSLPMRSARPGVARRAQGPEPAHDISNSCIPHLHILSNLCQDFVAFDHRGQKARSLFRYQVAADSSLMLSPP